MSHDPAMGIFSSHGGIAHDGSCRRITYVRSPEPEVAVGANQSREKSNNDRARCTNRSSCVGRSNPHAQ